MPFVDGINNEQKNKIEVTLKVNAIIAYPEIL